MMSRDVISYSDFYKHSQREKIALDIGEFSEELIERPISAFSVAIGGIIRRHNRFSTAARCIKAIPEIENNLLSDSEEGIKELTSGRHLYIDIRAFIHKDEIRIKEILNYKEFPFPESRKAEYLATLSSWSYVCKIYYTLF